MEKSGYQVEIQRSSRSAQHVRSCMDFSTTVVDLETEPTSEPIKAIGPRDYCDNCKIAKAMYLVKFPFGELFFCGHHFTKHEASLIEKAYEIFDDTDYIES